MNRSVIFVVVVLFSAGGITVDINAQDGYGKASYFIRDILGGDAFEQELLKDHPGGNLSWGEKVVADGEDHFTCLVYSEFTQPGKEPLYHFFEVKVRYVPPSEIANALPKNNN